MFSVAVLRATLTSEERLHDLGEGWYVWVYAAFHPGGRSQPWGAKCWLVAGANGRRVVLKILHAKGPRPEWSPRYPSLPKKACNLPIGTYQSIFGLVHLISTFYLEYTYK